MDKRERAAWRRWVKKREKELEAEIKEAGNDDQLLFEAEGKRAMLDEVEEVLGPILRSMEPPRRKTKGS